MLCAQTVGGAEREDSRARARLATFATNFCVGQFELRCLKTLN